MVDGKGNYYLVYQKNMDIEIKVMKQEQCKLPIVLCPMGIKLIIEII